MEKIKFSIKHEEGNETTVARCYVDDEMLDLDEQIQVFKMFLRGQGYSDSAINNRFWDNEEE